MTAFITELDRDSNVPFSSFKFSDGTIQVRLLRQVAGTEFEIRAHLGSSDDIMEVLMLTDAIRSASPKQAKINLVIPYFPYARQDRPCQFGEAFSARVMCDLINAQKYHRIEVWDAHSDVVKQLLGPTCYNKSGLDFVKRIQLRKNSVLVAPDKGAAQKFNAYGGYASVMGVSYRLVTGNKARDPHNGEIVGYTIDASDIGDADFLIVDDICDGGRTFIEAAKQLRPKTRGKVLLYVTHGIFSKGFEVFDGLIDHIYCANPFPGVSSPILTKI